MNNISYNTLKHNSFCVLILIFFCFFFLFLSFVFCLLFFVFVFCFLFFVFLATRAGGRTTADATSGEGRRPKESRADPPTRRAADRKECRRGPTRRGREATKGSRTTRRDEVAPTYYFYLSSWL